MGNGKRKKLSLRIGGTMLRLSIVSGGHAASCFVNLQNQNLIDASWFSRVGCWGSSRGGVFMRKGDGKGA